MSTNETAARPPQGAAAAVEAVAKQAPTEQQASQPGAPKRFEKGQTVCNEKNDKGKLCNGHLKQVSPIREEAKKHMRGDDLLYCCQTCGTLYAGPPLGHVRDPRKQARYVQSELVTILEAAGGTLPAFKRNDAGAWVPLDEVTPHAPAPVAASGQDIKPVTTKTTPSTAAAATPSTNAAPASSDETPEQKRARIIAEAKAKAAARMAGGVGAATVKNETSNAPPATPAAADAPAGESVEEKRARIMAEVKAKAAAKMAAAKGDTTAGSAAGSAPAAVVSDISNAPPPSSAATTATTTAPAGETPEQKRGRIMAEVKAKAAAKMAAKGAGANAGGETSIATPPLTAQPPSPTSGTDSSSAADAHRPAAEAQAATGQASAAPMSPAAATASPAAGAETVADLAPDASTELTPGAPRDESATDENTNL